MNEKKEVGFNTRCENFKRNLIDNINQSNLPISIVYYIMTAVMSDVESTYYGVLNNEAQEYAITEEIEVAKND